MVVVSSGSEWVLRLSLTAERIVQNEQHVDP